MKICLEAAIDYPNMDCGGIYIEEEMTGNFQLIQHFGLSDEFVRSASIYSPDSKNARIIREGKPIFFNT